MPDDFNLRTRNNNLGKTTFDESKHSTDINTYTYNSNSPTTIFIGFGTKLFFFSVPQPENGSKKKQI
jgi:hypothetical protein